VSAAATLAGSGAITTATLLAILQAAANLTGTGSVTAAMTAYGNILAALAGVGALTAPPYGTGELEATITIGGTTYADAGDVAEAVWSALAAANNDPDTMGELLNGAGGGSSPSQVADAVWDELMSGHTTDGSFGYQMQKLLTLAKFLGLK
jgi:hypothetical protein